MSPKILVVDDDALTRKLIKLALEQEGFVVSAHGTAKKALEAAAAELPDLALLDHRLPDLSGVELARRIRALPGAESIPILALTGMEPSSEDAALFRQIMLKPIDPLLVVEVVRSHTKMR